MALQNSKLQGDYGIASELRYSIIPKLQAQLPQEEGRHGEILHESVSTNDIEAVVSRQTGIPITKLISGEVEKLVNMEDTTAIHLWAR